MKRFVTTLITILLATTSSHAQAASEKSLKDIATEESTLEWLFIKPELNISPDDFFMKYKETLGFTKNDNFILLRSETDNIGMTHARYEQFYKGIKIEGKQYILHSRHGKLLMVNGKVASGLEISVTPTISEQDALTTAYNAIDIKKFAWQDSNQISIWTKYQKQKLKDIYPKGELAIINSTSDSGAYVLVWKFIIRAANPTASRLMFVNAVSNQVITSIPIIHNCIATSGPTTWHGSQAIKTSYNGTSYILREQCNSTTNHGNVHTLNFGNNCPSCNYTSSNNTWSSTYQSGIGAHRYARMTLDFYYNYFNRNSFDNAGSTIYVYNQNSIPQNGEYNNAYFDGYNGIYLGNNGTSTALDDFGTIDIIGHEITHGVTLNTSGLNYSGESGALNEAFSDILGVATERYFEGACCFNWLMGEDRSTGAIRNLATPKQYNQPNTFQGQYWINTTNCTPVKSNDYCGVHTNSGVLNYWFYLLSQGGSGTNDNNYTYSISGVGFNDAILMIYRTLTVYLSPTSVYGDARNGSIQAAIDLFGNNSTQHNRVIQAWCAVGMGTCTGTCTPPASPVASAPGTSSAPGTGISSANLSWASSTGATGYYPAISQCPYGTTNVVWSPTNCIITTSTSVNTLPSGNLYRWNVAGSSNCSNATCKGTYGSQLYFNIPPVVSPAGSVSICSGGSIVLSTVKGNTVQTPAYQWYNNGTPINGATATTYTATTAGSYTVKMTYSCGTTDMSQATVVTMSSPATPSGLSPGSLSQGSPSIITSNGPTLTWNAINGNVGVCYKITLVNTSNSQTSTYNLTGANSGIFSGLVTGVTYKWNVQAFAGNSCTGQCSSSVSPDHFFQINTPCIIPATPAPIFGDSTCPGPSLYTNYDTIFMNWTNTGSNGYDIEIREYPYEANNVVYTQNCISTNYTTVTSPNIVPGKLYSWRVRATTNCSSCNSQFSKQNYFHVAPDMNPSGLYGGTYYVCDSPGKLLTTPTINTPAPGTITYQWYLAGNPINGATSNTYYATQQGNYYVRLKYSGSSVCSGNLITDQSFIIFLVISNSPAAPTLSGNTSVCEGINTSLTATAASVNSMYFWTGPNGFSSNNNVLYFPAITSASAGTYSCYVTTLGCQSPPATINLTVAPAPAASFNFNSLGNTATFVNTSTNATSYTWTFGDLQSSTQTNPVHTYASNNGVFNVCLTANKQGCNPSSLCKLITIGNGGMSFKTQPTFAKLFRDTFSTHKAWASFGLAQSPVDSSYVVTGFHQHSTTFENTIQYFKLDKNGNKVWVRALPSSMGSQPLQILKADTGYLLLFSYNNASAIMKVDEVGNKLVAKQFSGAIFNKFCKATGGYVGVGNGTDVINLVKVDNSGALVWQKQYKYSLFSSTTIFVRDIFQDAAGNFYTYGDIGDGQVFPPSPSYEALLVKFDANGSHVWSKYYATSSNVEDQILGALEDNSGNIIVTGYSRASTTSVNGFIAKLTSSGGVISAKSLSQKSIIFPVKSNLNTISCLTPGTTGLNYRILEIDPLLNITNEKEFKFRAVRSFTRTLDNRFVVSGQYLNNSATNDYRYNVFKVNFSDSSCLDSVSSTNLANLNFTLSNLSVSSTTPNITVANFNVNPVLSDVADTIVCQTCNTNVVVTANGNTDFCSGDSAVLNAPSGAMIYLWSNGATSNSINVKTTGKYSVMTVDSFGCIASSQPLNIVEHQLPLVNAGNDTAIVVGDSLMLGGTPTALGYAPFIYKWVPSVGLDYDTVENPIAKPILTTKYYLTITDSNGCSQYDTILVNVNPLHIADAIDRGQRLILYPNPNDGNFILEGTFNCDNTIAHIDIFDVLGRVVLTDETPIHKGKLFKNIDLENRFSGSYLLRLHIDNQVHSLRFVVH